MKMRILIAISLVVFASGCIGQQSGDEISVSQTKGLEITSFQTDLQEIEEGNPIRFEFSVQNAGGSSATNVYGLISGQRWDVYNQDETAPVWIDLGQLEGPNAEFNLPGEEGFGETLLVTPDVLEDSVTYPWNLQVFYNYETITESQMRAMTLEEARRQGEGGDIEESPVQVSNSGGPIQMDIEARTPYILSSSDQDIAFKVTITNAGEGNPFLVDENDPDGYGAMTSQDRNRVYFQALSPSGVDCGDSLPGEVELSTGKAEIICTVSASSAGLDQQPFADLTIRLIASYGYVIDDTTSIIVRDSFSR